MYDTPEATVVCSVSRRVVLLQHLQQLQRVVWAPAAQKFNER